MTLIQRFAYIPEQLSSTTSYDVRLYVGIALFLVLIYLAGKKGRPGAAVALGIVGFVLFQMFAWC